MMGRIKATLATVGLVTGLAAGAGLVGLALGHREGYRAAQAEGRATLAKLHATQAQLRAQNAEQATRRLAAEVQHGQQLAQQLAAEREHHATEKQALLKRIAHVTTVYVPVPGAAPEPLPRAVFTAGFVRQYNAAIGLDGAPMPASTRGAAAPGAGQAPAAAQGLDAGLRHQFADLFDSGLSQADLLGHIADYGERCRNLESQLNRLLDRAQVKTPEQQGKATE